MLMYAYIGEKVPWLIIQQLLPMCLAATWCLREKPPEERMVRWNGWKWVTVAFLLFSIFVPIYGFGLLYTTHHVQFVREDISEPIVQVQNSEDLRGVFADMNEADKVVIASQNYWPLPWYYRGDRWNKIQFYGNKIDESAVLSQNPDVVLTDSGSRTTPCRGTRSGRSSSTTGSAGTTTRTGSPSTTSTATASSGP